MTGAKPYKSKLLVSDFEPRTGALAVAKDKGGSRMVVLPPTTSAHFAEAAKERPGDEWLFIRTSGKQWARDGWDWFIKRAAKTAGLPENTVAYTLRHSVITDLIGVGLDALTVARLSGTSLEMIDRHYGHLLAKQAAVGLQSLTF